MGNEQSKSTPGSDPVRRKRYKSSDSSQLNETKSEEGISVRVAPGATSRRANRVRRNRSYGPTETQTKLNFMSNYSGDGSRKKGGRLVVSKSMSDLLEGRRMMNDDGSPPMVNKVVTNGGDSPVEATNGGEPPVEDQLHEGAAAAGTGELPGDEAAPQQDFEAAETQLEDEANIQQDMQVDNQPATIQDETAADHHHQEETEDEEAATTQVVVDIGVCDSEDETHATHEQQHVGDNCITALLVVEQIVDQVVESSSSSSSADELFDDATAMMTSASDDEQPPSGVVAREVIDDIITEVINQQHDDDGESETRVDDDVMMTTVECGVDTESTNVEDNPQTNKTQQQQLKLMINPEVGLDGGCDCEVSSNDSFISATDDGSDDSGGMGNQQSTDRQRHHRRNRGATDQQFESCESTPTFADSHMDPATDEKLFDQGGDVAATEVHEDISQVAASMERGSSSSSSSSSECDADELQQQNQQHQQQQEQSDSDGSSGCCSYVLSDTEQQLDDDDAVCVGDDNQTVVDNVVRQDGNVLAPVVEHQEELDTELSVEQEVLAPVAEHQEELDTELSVEQEVLTPVAELSSEDQAQIVEATTEPQAEKELDAEDTELSVKQDVDERSSEDQAQDVEEIFSAPVVEAEQELSSSEEVVDDNGSVAEHHGEQYVVASSDDAQVIDDKSAAVVEEGDASSEVVGHQATVESEDDTDSFKSAEHVDQQQEAIESDDEADNYEQCKSEEEECNGSIPEIRLECATDSSVCSHSQSTSSSDDEEDNDQIQPEMNEDLQLKLNEIVSDALRGAIGELRDFYVRKSQQESDDKVPTDVHQSDDDESPPPSEPLQRTEAAQTDDVAVQDKSTEAEVVQQTEAAVQTDDQDDDDDIQFVEQCENCLKMQNEAKMFFRGYMLALRRQEELKIGNKWGLKQRGKASPMQGSIVSGSSIQNSLTSSVGGGLDPNLSSLSSDASVQELRDALNSLEDKYKKSMVQNAQLDNERTQLVYQTQQLRDLLEEQDDEFYRLKKEHREKCQEVEKQKRLLGVMNKRNNDLKHALQQRDELIQQQGVVLIGATDDTEDQQQQNARSTYAVVTPEAARLLEAAGDGTLDEKLKHLAEEIEGLQDTVKVLRKEANERERNEMLNGGGGHDLSSTSSSNINEMEILEIQRETNKLVSEYKVKIQKSEQDVAGLQANVQRLETQLQRHKQTSEMLEKNEDEMRADKRKLQRDLRTALDRIEEHEITITHLERRLDRARAARGGTNNQT